MKISQLKIHNFRGIRECCLLFPDHVVLVGDNNAGKTTILEALNLVLGPDRLNRYPPINEHDFHNSQYLSKNEGSDNPKIKIEVIISGLSDEQERHFNSHIEWWNKKSKAMQVENIDSHDVVSVLRVSFIGEYDEETDDFIGNSVFTSTLEGEPENPTVFKKSDKQKCGFLYLRSLRTGNRALSLERGSLLDIILRIKEIRSNVWEDALKKLNDFKFASDESAGISGVLSSIEESMKKYVPHDWGGSPHLKISNLTRENLRQIITAFLTIHNGDDTSIPFYQQGTGTINILVLAMLSQIASDKQNVIFAMEEPETAIPPYTQRQIVHEVRKLSSQSLFTSHSPYVIEEFEPEEVIVLCNKQKNILSSQPILLPEKIKRKRYRQNFRKQFCEGLLSSRILLAEGATEESAITAVAQHLARLNNENYSTLESLGITVIDVQGEGNIVDMASLYKELGKQIFVLCDKQTNENEQKIKEVVDELFMHEEKGIEELVLKNTTQEAIGRFSNLLADNISDEDARERIALFFQSNKGNQGVADFLVECKEDEISIWLRDVCSRLKKLCEKKNNEEVKENTNDTILNATTEKSNDEFN